MKILITGASGFIGGSLARSLAQNADYKVVATGRSDSPINLSEQNIEYLKLDLNQTLPELEFDICIHAAGLADDNSTDAALKRNNIDATENLLRQLKHCKIFIFISSSSVYNFRKFPFAKEEDASLEEELSAYGRSKLLAEKVVEWSSVESIYILRPRAVYGPYDRTLLPRVQSRFKNGKIVIPGDLHVKSSLTHIDNIVEVVDRALQEGKEGISVYNVSDKEHYVLRDVFTKIGLQRNLKVSFKSLPVGLVTNIVRIFNFLRIPISISQQSIDYITLDSTIDITKVSENLDVNLEHNFDQFMSLNK